MAPLSTNAIPHFMHPAHKLDHLTTDTSYRCDGCQEPGTGSRFTCIICSFDLHDYCAKCPTPLTTKSHDHPMSLVVHKPNPNQTTCCQICRYPIKPLAYQCSKGCNFWVHPRCVSPDSGDSQNDKGPSAFRRIGEPLVGSLVGGLASRGIYDGVEYLVKHHEHSVDSNASVSGEGTSGGVPTTTYVDEPSVDLAAHVDGGAIYKPVERLRGKND